VAWFIIAAVMGRSITIYGDGKQVRDILHVEDLLNAYDLAVEKIDTAKGQVYNIGGGPDERHVHLGGVWSEA
jgi:CDP-paratose 2-epimerase